MVVSLWRRRNRCRATMAVQSLRSRAARILGYRLIRCDLVLNRALRRLALGQRRHRRTGCTRCNRRLAFLISAAKADIGETLQERKTGLLRMLLLGGLAAGLAELGLCGRRKVLELRHPVRAAWRAVGRREEVSGKAGSSAGLGSGTGNSEGFCAIGRTVTSP